MDLKVYLLSSTAIMVSFNVLSVFSEKLNDTSYNGQKFVYSSFMLVINYLFVFLSSIIAKRVTGKQNFKNMFKKELLIASFFSVVSLECAINIGYTLSYLFAILFRSSKFLSLVIASFIFGNKKNSEHTGKNLIFALCTTVGLVIFASGGHFSGKSELVGFLYGIMSLIADCLVSHNQEKLKHESSAEFDFITVMQVMNFWNLLVSIVLCFFIKQEFWPAVHFVAQHPPSLVAQLVVSIAFTLGNFFIFFHLTTFGSVNLAYVTSVRKVITIFVSCVFFAQSLNTQKIIGIGIIILCVAADIHENYKKSKNSKKTK